MPEKSESAKRVALFATCLVDLFRPGVGFAAVRLLESAGYAVEVPEQGCCGQPNFNSGDRDGARAMAADLIRRFAGYDYVVAPSGSCAAMISRHFPGLFEPGTRARAAADELAGRTFELVSFLHDVAGFDAVTTSQAGTAVYHDGCSGLRELGIKEQPRKLLESVRGLTLTELKQPDLCCGFGGMFCVKYPDIANEIVGRKCRDIRDSGAGTLIAGDLGCLLHMEGRLHRDGIAIRALHVAEVLAGRPGDDDAHD